ncbi:MAG: indole-3-glycerol phosphate synthase TrpC [Planctomycetaceae bacterium]|jgi:indole-3-glycerol phosphate synthase|nr:indole-3-glycerol phosphate synthase TrpC [Planctomycetaceae bacterium]
MNKTVLEEIVASRKADYHYKNDYPSDEYLSLYKARPAVRPFIGSLKDSISRNRPAIIAEVKRGSPAKGKFAMDIDPADVAKDYQQGGAACMSVLTEPKFFYGDLCDLRNARDACLLPVLQKDFIVKEFQIFEAALYADAILLIARYLEKPQIKQYYDIATELNLDVLVEVFDESDIEKISAYDFPLVGINNRNLATMGVDFENAKRFASWFKPEQIVVAASGISSRKDIERFWDVGIKTFLVGESLSTANNRVELLREFVNGDK